MATFDIFVILSLHAPASILTSIVPNEIFGVNTELNTLFGLAVKLLKEPPVTLISSIVKPVTSVDIVKSKLNISLFVVDPDVTSLLVMVIIGVVLLNT